MDHALSGDVAWVLVSAALVLFMTLPGLALFYGGLVRSKNVLSIMAQCMGIAGLVTITPACGFVDATGAIVVGVLGGAIPYFACTKLKSRFGYDDATRVATFAVTAEKRSTMQLVVDHLLEHAPVLKSANAPEALALPQDGAMFGTVQVNKDQCTLCMSCVSACPAQALQDNPALPQLRFLEQNCVQCGLCATTCPEKAIALTPRWLVGPQRGQAQVLNQTQPYACIRCSKPFGTLKAIEAMLERLEGHPMFQGAAADRLKMCGDCRVIDIYSSGDEQKIQ